MHDTAEVAVILIVPPALISYSIFPAQHESFDDLQSQRVWFSFPFVLWEFNLRLLQFILHYGREYFYYISSQPKPFLARA